MAEHAALSPLREPLDHRGHARWPASPTTSSARCSSRPTALWWVAFAVGVVAAGARRRRGLVRDPDRHRRLGPQPHRRLGVRHHQLRVLGRHRPRRHADLGHPLPVPAEVAHQHQPLGRGDDPVRRDVRRRLPAHPHGASLARLLRLPVPERSRPAVGELPLAAALGRVRDQHLLHRLGGVLVRRPDPRSGDGARSPGDAACKKRIFSLLSLGWTGSARIWARYETLYLLLAGLATPLVLSVHTIVSMDFATSVIPGWHTTIFPPYFVAGAVFSGFAMVLTLMIIARAVHGPRAPHHPAPPREHGQDHHRDRRHRRPGLRDRVLHRLVLAATPTSGSPSSTAPPAPSPGPTGSW